MAGKCDTVKRDRAACDSAKGDGATPAAPQVIRQVLPARAAPAPGVTALLDAVVEGGRLRVFLGAGTRPAAFHPDGGADCLLPLELREISGSLMAVFDTAGTAPPYRLALAEGGCTARPGSLDIGKSSLSVVMPVAGFSTMAVPTNGPRPLNSAGGS